MSRYAYMLQSHREFYHIPKDADRTLCGHPYWRSVDEEELSGRGLTKLCASCQLAQIKQERDRDDI